ncbi:MAG: porin family protein [Bacteroidales bacterium]|nr:porin family protein [Bacteroidales bacterium]
MMKKAVLILALAMMAIGASAQLRFGVKAGVGLNSIHLDNLPADFESENRTGFTGGVMVELNLPLGLGVDASAMYTRRSGAIDKYEVGVRDYLSVPVNLKYKFGMPIVGSVVKPFIFTGPELAFNIGKKQSEMGTEYKKFAASWNIGLGVELINHVQVAAAYNMGISKSISNVLGIPDVVETGAKDRCWTITAAYLF